MRILIGLLVLFSICLCAQKKPMDLKDVELVDIKDLDASIILDLRYATKNNVTGKKIYNISRCLLAKPAAEALVRANAKLKKQGLVLKIYDGYRPVACQWKLWEICPDERYVANPKKGSRHNRGCAVDITLCDLKTGKELEMPTGFDDFSKRAHRGSPLWSENIRKNCKILDDVMFSEGFAGISTEWWHFDYMDWKNYPLIDIPLEDIPTKKKEAAEK